MESHPIQRKLIIANAEKCVRDHLATACRRLEFDVAKVSNSKRFTAKLSTFAPEIIIMDLDVPETETMAMLKAVSRDLSDAEVIFTTGDDDYALTRAKIVVELLGLNEIGALRKPVVIDELRTLLNKAAPPASPTQIQRLFRALKGSDIRPAYQARAVRRANGGWAISEVEAFARWHGSERDNVFPDQVTRIAEEAGLLRTVTWSLLKQIVRQMRDWDDRGYSIDVSLDLPPSMLLDTAMPEALERLLKKYRLGNSRLTLELTEACVLQSAGYDMAVIEKLHTKGFGLSIDNFGTGYSSIEQLYHLPCTELQIDPYLVRAHSSDSDAAKIIKAIVMLGHALDMSVCGKGVESPGAFKHLVDAGCDKLQGCHIGRPGSAKYLEELIRQFDTSGLAPGVNPVKQPGANRVLPILCR